MPNKVLIVDDSRAMRCILAKIIAGLGFEVLQAGDGLQALAILGHEHSQVRLVLSDWNMPTMDGLAFVKAVRADQRFAALPIVMVTTETHIEQMIVALSAGANEYIMKPFTTEMVEDKLRMLQVVR
ncbi:Chemotaxis regulator - transmits chemoreceptor signals to flagelllar motor components CheY [Acidisarcina polymorpha]|uniref:Chemotaxis regulator-transmits chemoreceptor signals to flagelllar motor components CheY n=1 Tax=Acidisarcina polymorpha TaxID=2211140 RepID=A0A2Z5G1H9_9BACT|nr:response regulator [Acidisarcina polymorpha]AXC12890.1 Chemotaxis regulator - transmits chemoreceptor signals to flagelllar motor components CheY [Acidisarcina polymorpha]